MRPSETAAVTGTPEEFAKTLAELTDCEVAALGEMAEAIEARDAAVRRAALEDLLKARVDQVEGEVVMSGQWGEVIRRLSAEPPK